jgi:hypothetical protein
MSARPSAVAARPRCGLRKAVLDASDGMRPAGPTPWRYVAVTV